MSKLSVLKEIFIMLWIILCVNVCNRKRRGIKNVFLQLLWLVLHLHGLCNFSLKDYC